MNIGVVEKIADAVLYEGYLLYPYRSSAVKNQQRFNFGVLYPSEFCKLQSGCEAWEMTTECLVSGGDAATVEVKVRFLQMIVRDGRQEGHERDVSTLAIPLERIIRRPLLREFAFAADAIKGEVELGATQIGKRLFRFTLKIRNRTKVENAASLSRDEALLRSLVSIHSILQTTGGEFISLLDPPEEFKAAAATCQQDGAWPVLAGENGQQDMMLSAPIILYDYPKIAPESAGDLFDGTEIDEILALRILTMTDEEKAEVRIGDDRARLILERTESLPSEHFQKLHGALRGFNTREGQPNE